MLTYQVPEYCPNCGAEATQLGNLGHLRWYRCPACGTEFCKQGGCEDE